MKKRGLACVLSGMLVLCGISSGTAIPDLEPVSLTAYATSKTADEAIAWVKSLVGKSIDMDGAPADQPYQCVDLIKAYYEYLGVDIVRGDGKDFAYNELPADWKRIEGGTPEKGDILVYGPSAQNEWGHVAIYESDRSTYHQNVDGPYVTNITYTAYNGFTNPYWGVIRPNWSNVKLGVEMTTGAGQTIPDGDYWFASKVGEGVYIDPAPGTDVPAAKNSNVATVVSKTAMPMKCDTWTFTYLKNGFYKISQIGTDMCLDVTGASMEAGTNVQLYPWYESPSQMWSVEKTEWGIVLRSKLNSFVLDVAGSSAENGTNVAVWDWYGTTGQFYELIPYSDNMFKGAGTAISPYQIGTAEDLRELARLCNAKETSDFYCSRSYVLTADIDLDGKEFTPIATITTEAMDNTKGFKGIFDGNCHSITGVNIVGVQRYTGLFGWCYDGAIKNLNVYGSVEGTDHVGGIVGEIGNEKGVTISNCSFVGTVKADTKAGGIAGASFGNSNIESCYFNGTIESKEKDKAGGLIGFVSVADDRKVKINNSYSACKNKVGGGIIGCVNADYQYKASNFSVTNSYFLSASAEKGIGDTVVAGGKGLSDSSLKITAAELLEKPFIANGDGILNDGYPIFEWQKASVMEGDINGDGKLTVADAVMLQKWLLGSSKELNCWKNADLCDDGIIDVYDMVMLRRLLIEKTK